MGKYTVLENPTIDRLIDDDLSQIVSAITGRTSPESIILYGSPARGEASVLFVGDQAHMLSDYEIKVVGKSPRLRGVCATLSREMTARLGISTGIGWLHPSRLQTNQSGNFRSPSAPSIFMYELKACGQTLYGQDLLCSCPQIDPKDIPLESGITLILNRMAESLDRLPCSAEAVRSTRLEQLVWMNKTILACADALLLSAGSYHYSYRARGRRFAAIARQKFAPLVAKMPAMVDLVARATEFKIRPDLDLYPEDPAGTWPEVAAMADVVFRCLMEQQHAPGFAYAEYPDLCLDLARGRQGQGPGSRQFLSLLAGRMVEGIKYLEQRHLPSSILFSPYSAWQVVYALVPVLFQSCFSEEQARLMSAIRRWLGLLMKLDPPSPDPRAEWNYMRERLTWSWRVFCY